MATRQGGDKRGNQLKEYMRDRIVSRENEIKEASEPCRYCGGSCPLDEENACDGYMGDIDKLYSKPWYPNKKDPRPRPV